MDRDDRRSGKKVILYRFAAARLLLPREPGKSGCTYGLTEDILRSNLMDSQTRPSLSAKARTRPHVILASSKRNRRL